MHLKMFRIQRAFFALSTIVLSSACFISSSSAAPIQTTGSSVSVFGQATTSADESIVQLWQQQTALATSLESVGLVGHDDDEGHHQHSNTDGIGGAYDADNAITSKDRIADTINQVAEQVERRESSLNSLNQSLISRPQAKVQLDDILAVEPVANGRVTSPYGYRYLGGREFHPGVDLAAPYGSPVYATGTGVVVYSGWKNGYGNFIEIDHGNGYVTRYGHSSRLLVSVGQQIKKNQEIALVGCTGRCTGPHVHYEVLLNGQRQNPATYLALAPRREE